MQTIDSAATLTAVNHAGFGQRLVAWIIDVVIIWVVQTIVITPILAAAGLGIAAEAQNLEGLSPDEQLAAAGGLLATVMATAGTVMLVSWSIQILYYTFMESSKAQASVGKMAMGIKVVDTDGNRISIGKAFLRSFGKIISAVIIFIGFLMAAFTEKKQALHDMIANTYVVKK
jgi:uncharacterized RDD family membrane protein YckC